MQLSAELSLYPLDANYEEIVLAFIDTIAASARVSCVTNSMSSQIHGDSEAVIGVIHDALLKSHELYGKQVLVAKFIPEHQLFVEANSDA